MKEDRCEWCMNIVLKVTIIWYNGYLSINHIKIYLQMLKKRHPEQNVSWYVMICQQTFISFNFLYMYLDVNLALSLDLPSILFNLALNDKSRSDYYPRPNGWHGCASMTGYNCCAFISIFNLQSHSGSNKHHRTARSKLMQWKCPIAFPRHQNWDSIMWTWTWFVLM
jgi:hypothetical protein